MRPIIYLSACLMLCVSAQAQTTKSGHYSKTYSSGGSTSHHSSSNNPSYSGSKSHASTSNYSSKTYTKSTSGTNHGSINNEPNYNYNKKNKYSTEITIIEVKENKGSKNNGTTIYSKDVKYESNENTTPGIQKVGADELKPTNFEDKEKIESPDGNTDGNSSTNDSGTETQDTVVRFSETIPNSNSPFKYQIYIACGHIFTNKFEFLQVLNGYSRYYIRDFASCGNPFPEVDLPIITCEMFESMSEDDKAHVIDNAVFYDLTLLEKCETYQNYLLSRKK